MEKREQPTFGDLLSGRATGEQLKACEPELLSIFKAFVEFADSFVRYVDECEAEANTLIAALSDKPMDQAETYVRTHPPSAGAIAFLAFMSEDKYKSKRGRDNAAKRAAKYIKPKLFAQEAWKKHKSEYKSKADFSRIYAKLIEHQFGTKVAPNTISREWLD